jgi:hypothetical protein
MVIQGSGKFDKPVTAFTALGSLSGRKPGGGAPWKRSPLQNPGTKHEQDFLYGRHLKKETGWLS